MFAAAAAEELATAKRVVGGWVGAKEWWRAVAKLLDPISKEAVGQQKTYIYIYIYMGFLVSGSRPT